MLRFSLDALIQMKPTKFILKYTLCFTLSDRFCLYNLKQKCCRFFFIKIYFMLSNYSVHILKYTLWFTLCDRFCLYNLKQRCFRFFKNKIFFMLSNCWLHISKYIVNIKKKNIYSLKTLLRKILFILKTAPSDQLKCGSFKYRLQSNQ